MNMFSPLEDRVKSRSIENHEPTTFKPTEEYVEVRFKKIQTPFTLKRFDYSAGKNRNTIIATELYNCYIS